MPHAPLKLQPGVNTTRTPTLLEAGYKSASLVRWREGLPEKIGGWQKYFGSAVSGVPRALHAWQDLSDVDRLAVATTEELSVIANSTKTELTPQQFNSDCTVDFSTTNGSATVIIVDTNLTGSVTDYDVVHIKTPVAVGGLLLHGLYPIVSRLSGTSYTISASSNATADVTNGGATMEFDTVADSDRITVTLAGHGLSTDNNTAQLPFAVSVGGISLAAGVYDVLSVPTADTFTIVAPQTATATTSAFLNTGDARLEYYIAIGPDIVTGAGIGMVGFGALGQYGLGDGSSSAGISVIQQEGDPIASQDWTLENWGEILLAAPCTECDEDVGGIWYWQPGRGFQTMRLISTAPLYNTGIFLSQPAQILVAYGSTANENIGFTHDHLLVRWSHQQDFTIWNATATNYAGSYRLPSGSRIVGGMSTRQRDLIWTDIELWSMNYLGGQGSNGVSLVYGFQKIGTSCGLIAKHAAVSFRGNVYWMGRSNFYVLGANGVVPIPCTVWDAVFQDIDEDSLYRCWAVGNAAFDEIWFFYPSASGGTGQCDKYAKLNVSTGAWDHGPISGTTALSRSAGIDESVLGKPILASPSGVIYQHETGYDADGTAITWEWETGYFKLAEGQFMAFVDRIFPDFRYGTFGGVEDATIKITLKGANSPNETPREYGPYSVTQATDFISTRFRHRLMAIKVSGSDSASFSRLGQILFQYAPDGRR